MTRIRLLQNLFDTATDPTPTPDGLTISKINETAPASWPVIVPLSLGQAEIWPDGAVYFDNLGDDGAMPAAAQSVTFGSFTYRVNDGEFDAPSPATFTVEITGAAASATAPAAFADGDWSIGDAQNGGKATVLISSLPSDGGSTLTRIEYNPLTADMVTNGDFAADIAGWSAHNSASLAWNASGAIDVDSNGSLTGNAYQAMSVTNGETYVLEAQVSPSATASAILAIGTTLGQTGDITAVTVAAGQPKTKVRLALTATTTGTLYIRLGRTTNAAGDAVTFDDVRMWQVPTGGWLDTGLLGAGAFEAQGTAGAPLAVVLRAVNAVGAGAIGSHKSLIVTSGATTGDPAAHTTVANVSALQTLVDQFNVDYDGTAVANGGSAGSDFYIDCAPGDYTALNLSNVGLPNMLHIRARDKDGSCTINGRSYNNVSRISLEYFKCVADGSKEGLEITGNSDTGQIRRCYLAPVGPSSNFAGWPAIRLSGLGGSKAANTVPRNWTVIECYAERSNDAIKFNKVKNCSIIGCVTDITGGDDAKVSESDDILIEDNWFSTVTYAAPSAHSDPIQIWSTGGLDNCERVTIRGNVAYTCRDANRTAKPFRQGAMVTTGNGGPQHDTIDMQQNIFVVQNSNGTQLAGTPNVTCKFNDFLLQPDSNGDTKTIIRGGGAGSVFDKNIERATTGKSGSLLITTAQYSTYYGGLDPSFSGQLLTGSRDASDIIPPAGVATHWSDPSPVGAYLRKQDIAAGVNRPDKVGWPIAGPWSAGHNRFGRFV